MNAYDRIKESYADAAADAAKNAVNFKKKKAGYQLKLVPE